MNLQDHAAFYAREERASKQVRQRNPGAVRIKKEAVMASFAVCDFS